MKKKILVTMIAAFTILLAVGMISASAETDGIYTYSVSDGKATITDCDTSASGEITIPTTLGGYPVTSIGEGAFYYCSSLESIIIPEGVTSIGYSAFFGCSSLESITIPEGVTSIGNYAFSRCSSLEKVNITDLEAWCNINFLSESANPLYPATNLYLNGNLVTNLIIPEGVTSIGAFAFSGCSNLESITIPDSVTSIGQSAFSGCNSLEKVNITDLKAWCNINFSEQSANPLYPATNLYLNGNLVTNLIIPEGVTSIDAFAFSGCSSLKSITIPEGVTSIGQSAFYYCSSLESITISKSVTSIGYYAFFGCSSLTDIYYNGTDEGWNAVSIALNNDSLTNATVHFVQVEYRINEITIKDVSGNSLEAIPTGTFLATVSFTNVSSSEDTLIILAQYTCAGAFKGLMYIQTEDVPTGSTIKLSIPVDNSNGDVAKLKALCWESFSSLTPMGNPASFPAE